MICLVHSASLKKKKPPPVLSSPHPLPSVRALPGGGTHTAGGRSSRAAPSTVPALLLFLFLYIYMNSFEGIMAGSGVARAHVSAVSASIFSNPMSWFGPRFSCWLKATLVVQLFPNIVQSVQYPQFGFAFWLLVGNG